MGNTQLKLSRIWKEEQLYNPFGYCFQNLENGVKVSPSKFKLSLSSSMLSSKLIPIVNQTQSIPSTHHLEINGFFLKHIFPLFMLD